MNRFIQYNPVKWIFGKGSMKRLEAEVAGYGKNILVVYGGGSIKKNGLHDEVTGKLNAMEARVFELPGVEPNPRLSTVHKGVEICRKENIDFVLAVGGGSVIDCAKAIAAGAKYNGDVWDLILRGESIEEALPIGTVLTLAATGSEMNAGLVITNEETNEKISWHSQHLFPKFSICDPAYSVTVPHDQTVFGIVDIMCHILEQYFHNGEKADLQDSFSEITLKKIIETAPLLLKDLENEDHRAKVMYAGTIALNGTLQSGYRGDWTAHIIEHAVSGVYDIPHAGGLAILFPNWMEYTLEAHPARFKQLAVRVLGVDDAGKSDVEAGFEGIRALRQFWTSLGAPARLADYGIDSSRFGEIADQAMLRGEFGRFYPMNRNRVLDILQASL
ncbi:iron-containing alcohol dehydrogenase [Bacillus aerolatus]|uniref:Iron-containing alcohol dehydrogenase n=1 Tax=Bacillus aerolatus TaxID=2653354 RepID=A0A6I1FQU4_9BACI|nr:iron-containing alcohol dehydrogenase [Bacillus aerolatus]KAB7706938.1 iron-containing alcohol dehydrogenase [Bacillus aerolatus]